MKAGKLVVFALIWLAILGVGVGVWKTIIQPMQNAADAKRAEQEAKDILSKSTGNTVFKNEITIAADAFSGYAVLRSEEFKLQLAQRGIRVNIEDDQADYAARIQGLASGKYAMAAFPIDALIKASAETNQLPATIIAIIDESKGADAMVANKKLFAGVDALNRNDLKFVLVGDSPSETLARVVLNEFELPQVQRQPFVELAGPDEIIKNYRNAAPSTPNVYVTWEPYVSQMLADSEMHLVVDSSKFTGYIVDTLVVSRNFLAKNQATVEQVLESYFTALYEFKEEDEKVKLIMEDAEHTGTTITKDQAQSLVRKIQWKNTQENFAHMGLRDGKVLPLEIMIERILNLLKSSGAIQVDPTSGQLTRLFYDPPLAQLQTRNFHPGLGAESVLEQGELPPLDETQWGSLVSIGTLNIPDLVFARGSATLTESSQFTLDELVHKLQSWPNYYLRIRGSATKQGNLDANRALANDRAQAALEYLQSRGVSPNRMRVFDGETTGQTRVSFELGQSSF